MKCFSFFLLSGIFLTGISSAHTLMITDSHGEGAFGSEMVRLLEKSGDSVSVYAVGGSTPTDWSQGLQQVWGYWEYHTGGSSIRSEKPVTPKLEDLLNRVQPSRVIIALGTNLIWRNLLSQDSLSIEHLLNLVKTRNLQCFWVGQPDLRLDQSDRSRRNEEIKQLLIAKTGDSTCHLIPSWEFTRYLSRGGDGIHYDRIPMIGPDLAKKWAKAVIERLN